MDINTVLLGIDDLISSENNKNENLKYYQTIKLNKDGAILHSEFELIEKIIKLFANSLRESEIRILWEQTESGQNAKKSDNHELEIISAINDLESIIYFFAIKKANDYTRNIP